MRANLTTLPILAAALLVTIATALDSEPPQQDHFAEAGEMVQEPVMHTYTIPRFTADLEGDLSPVGDTSGDRVHDFPAWEAKPDHIGDVNKMAQTLEPDHFPDAGNMVEPVRTPLPVISAVPHECPAVFTEVFGANAAAWCAISWCESGWRLDAMNVSGLDDSHGPLQINFHGALGPSRLALIQSLGYPVVTVDEAKLMMRSDWHASLHVAYVLSSGGVDYSPWSCRRVLN